MSSAIKAVSNRAGVPGFRPFGLIAGVVRIRLVRGWLLRYLFAGEGIRICLKTSKRSKGLGSMFREWQGFCNPCGLVVRVTAGTGKGLDTRDLSNGPIFTQNG